MQPEVLDTSESAIYLTAEESLLTQRLGVISEGETKHFWSFGNFNMMRLVFWILEQTGPADILLSTYSISPKTLQGVMNRREKGIIRDIRFIVDNRVRSLSPKPFALMVSNFDYRCISIHAKVACIWNNKWHISVVTSQNATDNPKWERGTIFTDKTIFEFDKKVLEDAFLRGTT
ncbi:MAG: hypothetical protein A2W86_11780 [Bacteroidetes bacterium GWD2_45_23]|nr:MAG: hypothetical protein A2W87_08235 [Bacteroidetes bacterium GWC2_46_850]OFX70122.1 MAG: hypothetical protein A2071_04555 [Bacteroidetes bacterium GWC1_47_7]OFX85501.1 MAG: hypothetical protein A2W86_11780 [Bacteroidetes bacterium GWD2_45_23]HBB00725.1 hypothetical protein [Porphyromonadaceae bacterium]HCC19350.1 hypothetical protein [Porphyromonadaceae bacterium]